MAAQLHSRPTTTLVSVSTVDLYSSKASKGLSALVERELVEPFTARRYASAGTSYGPVSVCLCPSLSATSRSFIEQTGRIELVNGTEASFDVSYAVLYGNSVRTSKNKRISLWNFARNSELLKFHHERSIVEMYCQLCLTKVDAQRLIDRRQSAELTMPPSSDSRPLVYHSDRPALSTARFRRAGQLATAGASNHADW